MRGPQPKCQGVRLVCARSDNGLKYAKLSLLAGRKPWVRALGRSPKLRPRVCRLGNRALQGCLRCCTRSRVQPGMASPAYACRAGFCDVLNIGAVRAWYTAEGAGVIGIA